MTTQDEKIYRKAYYGVFMAFLGPIMFIYFPDLMEYLIQKNVKLAEGSTVTENWAEPPLHIYINFYLFNTTNFRDVRRGVPPNLSEVGPFVVRLKVKREILEWNEDDDTLTYKSSINFFYEEDMSIKGGDDPLWVVNLPVVGMVSLLTDMFPIATTLIPAGIINGQLKAHSETLMKKYTVKQFLVTGMKVDFLEPLIGLVNKFVNLNNLLKDNKIGILHMLNNSPPVTVTAHTGATEPYAMGEIIKVKSQKSPNVWRDRYCAMINGTEGSNYRHPVIQRYLRFFMAQLCRTLKLDYSGESNVNGIPTKKFIFDTMFASGNYVPENRCYCNDPKNPYCYLNGTFPVGPCLMGLPVTISQPHFHGADPFFLTRIAGLKPSKEKHESYFHIHPMLAMPLQVRVCLQFNLKVINHPSFPILANISNMMLPITWVKLEAGIMSSGQEDVVYYLLIGPPIVAKVIGGLLVFFGALRIGKAVLHYTKRKAGANETSSIKVYPIDTQVEQATIVEKF